MTVSGPPRCVIEADRPFAVYADGDHLADLPPRCGSCPGRSRVARARDEPEPVRSAPRLALARATGALSRRSGRGGGTTLPGRLLLRMAPDAIAQLRRQLTAGSTVISATNGKTTTAGMLAAALRAAGRDPVHNRAGSNMTWGVATALLEQAGTEGLFEVDEAWLPRVAARPRPEADRPRQPLPRPARPLRRARGAGRRLGRAGRRARRLDRVRAQRRRPADRRPRARPRPAAPAAASPTSGSRTPRRRCPSSSTPTTPSTAAAAAPRTPTSAPSSATSATTRAPTARPTAPRPTSPRPRSSCTG